MGAIAERVSCPIAVSVQHLQGRREAVLSGPKADGRAAVSNLPPVGVAVAVDVVKRETDIFGLAATVTDGIAAT